MVSFDELCNNIYFPQFHRILIYSIDEPYDCLHSIPSDFFDFSYFCWHDGFYLEDALVVRAECVDSPFSKRKGDFKIWISM